MKSMIYKENHKDQMVLAYDGLYPEEAFNLMDCVMADDMCEEVVDLEIELAYGVTGYRDENDKRIWSRDLAVFIEGIEAAKDYKISVEEQLAESREMLENLRKIIKERTGIE